MWGICVDREYVRKLKNKKTECEDMELAARRRGDREDGFILTNLTV